MKKLKILISTLSVMAFMCFANLASAQVAYVLTTEAGYSYPTGQIVQVDAVVQFNSNGKSLAITLPQTAPNLTDLSVRANAVADNTSTQISTSANQILITPDANTNLRALSNHFFHQGIAVSKEILMLLQ